MILMLQPPKYLDYIFIPLYPAVSVCFKDIFTSKEQWKAEALGTLINLVKILAIFRGQSKTCYCHDRRLKLPSPRTHALNISLGMQASPNLIHTAFGELSHGKSTQNSTAANDKFLCVCNRSLLSSASSRETGRLTYQLPGRAKSQLRFLKS